MPTRINSNLRMKINMCIKPSMPDVIVYVRIELSERKVVTVLLMCMRYVHTFSGNLSLRDRWMMNGYCYTIGTKHVCLWMKTNVVKTRILSYAANHGINVVMKLCPNIY